MKQIIVLLLITLTVSFVYAQKKGEVKVPEKVKDAVVKAYPEAKNVKWEKEGDKFEANLNNNNIPTSLVVTSDGKIVETEVTIEKTMLPKGVEELVSKNYKGYKITETAKIVDDKGVTTYEVQITKGKIHKDCLFDKEGKPLEKNEEEND